VYSEDMEKTTLYLPPELHRALKEAARREGKSQAELIREALAAYLTQRQRPAFRSLGVGEDEELSGRASEGWLERVWSER
ncbi:ribbon-helix-helix domain-containing protein, partial [Proteus terrae]